jgi:hypothetical protein
MVKDSKKPLLETAKGVEITKYLKWLGIGTAILLGIVLFSLSFCGKAQAETKTLSWNPVTQYTDNTPVIAPALPVTYDAFWATTIARLATNPVSLIANTTSTSVVFDIITQGMVRGSTIYFSARAKTAIGETSANSPGFAWTVPGLVLSSLAITSGPTSMNEGTSATFVASATWNDGSVTVVTPTWTVAPTTYASISAGGILTAFGGIIADHIVTVTATFVSGTVTQTASRSVTIINSTGPVPPSGFTIQ